MLSSFYNTYATNYYISNDGNNGENGLSPETAWETAYNLLTTTLQPGDSVLFRCGDIWRTTNFNINQSGTPEAYITIASYGVGDKPKLLGSRPITTWTQHASLANVWVNADFDDYPGVGGAIAQLFLHKTGTVDNMDRDSITWGNILISQDPTEMNQDYQWTYSNEGVIWLYYSGNPNDDFEYTEAPQTTNFIEINHQDYIAFNNLEIAFCSLSGIRDSYPMLNQKGLKVTNCYIHHIGYKGSPKAYGVYLSHSDAYYAYNEIHDCGRRSLSLSILDGNFDNGRMENVVIEHNHFHHGWHTTGIDGIIGAGDVVDSIIIRNNFFEGSPEVDLTNGLNAENSNHIFLSAKAKDVVGDTSSYTGVYVYNNIFTYTHGKAVMFENVDDSYICNNTFYGMNPTLPNAQSLISLSASSERNTVLNNIFYNDDDQTTNPSQDLLTINITIPGLRSNSVIDYNLHYSTDKENRILATPDTIAPGGWWIYSYTSWDYIVSTFSFEEHSPQFNPDDLEATNPMFIYAPHDFHVNLGSPAIEGALSLPFITDDYYGNPRDPATPTIGAIEFDYDPASAKIKRFELAQQVSSAIIDDENNTVKIIVEWGTDVTKLAPTIITSIGASINPASGVERDFTNIQTYTVTAFDGVTKQDWTVEVTVTQPNSKNLLEANNSIFIYPNPANSFINVMVTSKSNIKLFDTSGKLVKNQTLNDGANNVSLESFKPGMYILEVLQEDKVTIKKLIVK